MHRLPLADYQFISDFAAFCRTKGDEEYEYFSACDCALGQFFRVRGESDWDVMLIEQGPLHLGPAVQAEPNTFSALVDRLEALLAGSPVELVA